MLSEEEVGSLAARPEHCPHCEHMTAVAGSYEVEVRRRD
jgi:hypothetical protein